MVVLTRHLFPAALFFSKYSLLKEKSFEIILHFFVCALEHLIGGIIFLSFYLNSHYKQN